ncbi:MAG TPA: hypothetical protein VMF13_04505 [Luteitalea sp.]|nr:hypothetical protein [Luteitalea sp.]
MEIGRIVAAEIESGLPRLRGLTARADIPVTQAVLDEALRLAPGLPRDLRVEIGADRQLLIRVGPVHANARLAPGLSLGPRPRLTIELASQLVAWGLRAVTLPSFVSVEGRLVHVDLASVPALRPAAPWWPHLQQVTFTSTHGRLAVHAAVQVT